mgnify:FL=1|tara:strand:- start:400 stop:699 length:300 start_codon:yes stop_codon:yes gene_type:complete
MKNLKDQLAGIAALIAAIIAIGGGFVKYGEITTRLDALTNASKTIDLSIIAVMEEKITALESIETEHGHTKMLVNAAEIKLLKVQIEEIKVSTSNPLAN